jgi:4-hydroxy-3-methylbut-2-enyl diphosphate reductase
MIMEETAHNQSENGIETPRRLLVAAPRGFCAGVDRAVAAVELALQANGPPVYVRRQIVHNRHVVDRLIASGVVFVEELAEVPAGSVVVLSAHGVAPEVRRAAHERDLRVIDATCPLVTKVHLEAHLYAKRGLSVLLIGHAGHDEVLGVMGELPGAVQLISSVADARSVQVPVPERVGVLMQTTLSVDDSREILTALQRRFPALVVPAVDDICYATQNRQRAVRAIAARAELVIVLGSANSSNARRLCEVAQSCGAAACLVDEIGAVNGTLLGRALVAGLTASASTPEWIVQQAIVQLASHGFGEIEEVVIAEERVSFAPPHVMEAPFIPVHAVRSAAS